MSDQSIDTLYLVASDLREALTNGEHENLPDSDISAIWAELIGAVRALAPVATPADIARILKVLPLSETTELASRPNRQIALATADELGPEAAQNLYHFAVLVTKLR